MNKEKRGHFSYPPRKELAKLDLLIGVGFGDAQVKRDEDLIFAEGRDVRHNFYCPELASLLIHLLVRGREHYDGFPMLADIEELARHDPDHDWHILLNAPLWNAEYQRHGAGTWVLISSGRGFA